MLFTHEGGVDIGDVDAKALKLDVGIEECPTEAQIKEKLLVQLTGPRKEYVLTGRHFLLSWRKYDKLIVQVFYLIELMIFFCQTGRLQHSSRPCMTCMLT